MVQKRLSSLVRLDASAAKRCPSLDTSDAWMHVEEANMHAVDLVADLLLFTVPGDWGTHRELPCMMYACLFTFPARRMVVC